MHAKGYTLLSMTLGFVVVQLDVTVVNVATQTIGASIGGSVSSLQWVVNAYTLAFASLILTAGAMGDRIGAKRVFATGFMIFTAASLGCAVSPSLPFLIVSRLVQGFGAAILVPCSLALLNHTYPGRKEKEKAVGIWAAGASIALATGPIVGGLLINSWGWRSIFLINLPIGALGIWLSSRYAKETPGDPGRNADPRGQIAAIAALTVLATALISGGKQGWTNAYVIGGMALFIVLFGLFLRIESKTIQPMLPLSLFRSKAFSATTIIGFLLNISFYGLLFIVSLYFQRLRGYTPLKTGLAFLPMMVAVFLANILASRLSGKMGQRLVITAGGLLFLAGCLLLVGVGNKTGYPWIAPQLAAIGMGVGLVVPPMTSAMLDSVEKSRSGIASAILNSVRQTGSVVGVALFGSLIAHRDKLLQGLHLSLIISCALLLVTVLSARAIPSRKDLSPA